MYDCKKRGLMKEIKKEYIKKVHRHLKRVGKKEDYNFFFRYKYKKTTVLILSIILAYYIFTRTPLGNLVSSLGNLSYLGIFIVGMALAFGFLAPVAAGFLITLDPSNILINALIASIGTVLSDILMFKFMKFSFSDEFKNLKKTQAIKNIHKLLDQSILHKIKIYLYYSFIGIMIASPLPDEIGVSMLAGLTKIKPGVLAVISFVLHFIGIVILLLL